MSSSRNQTRKEVLGQLVMLPALAGLVAAATTTASADAKTSQSAVKYQNTPNNGKKCSGCKFFIPGSSASANGACKVVAGSISPNGWCIAYEAK